VRFVKEGELVITYKAIVAQYADHIIVFCGQIKVGESSRSKRDTFAVLFERTSLSGGSIDENGKVRPLILIWPMKD
jgi:hypothetical protein